MIQVWVSIFSFEFPSQGGHKSGKPGILRDFSDHGKLVEFSGNSVQPQEKIITNKIVLSNICIRQLLTG